jgi:hypothetical protein
MVHGTWFKRASDDQQILTKAIGEQHIMEDFGGEIPDVSRFEALVPKPHLWEVERLKETLALRNGGKPGDYVNLVAFFDKSPLIRNSFGIFLAEQVWGVTFNRFSDLHVMQTRYIAEKLILAAYGHIPTMAQTIDKMPHEPWLCRGAIKLSQQFIEETAHA